MFRKQFLDVVNDHSDRWLPEEAPAEDMAEILHKRLDEHMTTIKEAYDGGSE